jgi:formylglycine-generating enzyme required for sulfatase activity
MEKTGKSDPDTYYIMEDKVWVGLYRQFARQAAGEKPPLGTRWEKLVEEFHPDKDELGEREEPPYKEDYPVLGVSAEEADRCAAWLGGKLPLPNQWDKAAGFYGERKGKGPYDPTHDPLADPKHRDIAVGRSTPLPRGAGRKDVTPLGCRDMAGNGVEWTASTIDDSLASPPRRSPRTGLAGDVNVRGRHFVQKVPYDWKEIADGGGSLPGSVQSFVGFRVVIEP